MSPTASQVDRAGVVLRAWLHGHREGPTVDAALQTLLMFRSEHAAPLGTATMGLRSAVETRGQTAKISQRLKRVPTILDKLDRLPDLKLSRLQDIGGCRAILPDLTSLRIVQEQLCDPRAARVREIRRIRDYVASPRESGYRSVHVIVAYQGRSIEVQLRTEVMHLWAYHVERLTQKYGMNLREASDPDVRSYLAAISEAMAIEETGDDVPGSLVERIDALRVTSLRRLEEGR